MRNENYGPAGLVSVEQHEPDLDTEKERVREELKETIGDALSRTDWYVIREAEQPSKQVPADVKAARSALRDIAQDIDDLIDAAADFDALQAITLGFTTEKDTLDQKAQNEKSKKPKKPGGPPGGSGPPNPATIQIKPR